MGCGEELAHVNHHAEWFAKNGGCGRLEPIATCQQGVEDGEVVLTA